MPELPEVETVRRGLESIVTGGRIVDVKVHDPRGISRHDGDTQHFESAALALTADGGLQRPQRRGKFMWIPADDGAQALTIHLGMSGRMLLHELSDPVPRHARVQIWIDNHGKRSRLDFDDPRMFGSLAVRPLVADPHQPVSPGDAPPSRVGNVRGSVHTPQVADVSDDAEAPGRGHSPSCMTVEEWMTSDTWCMIPDNMVHIAADPLEAAWNLQRTTERIRRRRQAIKAVLLDQGVVSGIGNIYADESLWAARVHYLTPAHRLSVAKVRELLECAREIMAEACEAGGTSFDAVYVNVNGESGRYGDGLQAYGRAGEPCRRCGTLMCREAWSGRSSYRCARCQRAPRPPRSSR